MHLLNLSECFIGDNKQGVEKLVNKEICNWKYCLHKHIENSLVLMNYEIWLFDTMC